MTQFFELCGIRWCFILFCSSLQYRSSKITPSLFVDKASCTRQFESELSLHSLASLFPIKEGFFRKPTFNSLFDPFGSPCRGQKPSLPLRKAPPLISVFSPQGRRGKPPYSADFSTSPSLLQGELHFLPKPLFLRKRRCNRPPVLRTATL